MHKYTKGQRVHWQDPDNGKSSGDYTIISKMSAIYREHQEEDSEDDIIVTIVNDSSEAEVTLSEIKPIILKAKVLTYKQDHNTLTEKSMNLEQITEHFFIANRKNESYGVAMEFILNVNGLFMREGMHNEQAFLQEETATRYEEYATSYFKWLLENDNFFPRYMELEIVRQTGTPEELKKLQARREHIEKQREAEEAEQKQKEYSERQQEEEQRRKEKEKEDRIRREDYGKDVKRFLEGLTISNTRFLEMLKRNHIKVSSHAQNNIKNHLSGICLDRIIGITKGHSYTSVFKAIDLLKDKLQSHKNSL